MSGESSNPQAVEPKQWGPLAAIGWVIVAFFIPQIIVALLFVPQSGKLHTLTTAQNFYMFGASALLTLLLLWRILQSRYHVDFRALGLGAFRWRYVGMALLAVPVYLVVSMIFTTTVSGFLPSFNPEQEQDLGFSGALGSMDLVLVFISLVILPPLVEELLFRGFLFKGFLKVAPPVLAAILVSVLFGFMHQQWNIGVDTFSLSLVLCYLAYTQKSLWPAIFLHAAKKPYRVPVFRI